MSRRVSPATGRAYGLQRVTRIWGVARATVYRHRHGADAAHRRKPGPLGTMADQVDFPPESGGMGSERHAAASMVTPSMPARASTGVR